MIVFLKVLYIGRGNTDKYNTYLIYYIKYQNICTYRNKILLMLHKLFYNSYTHQISLTLRVYDSVNPTEKECDW